VYYDSALDHDNADANCDGNANGCADADGDACRRPVVGNAIWMAAVYKQFELDWLGAVLYDCNMLVANIAAAAIH
jgi:hypothetical protein